VLAQVVTCVNLCVLSPIGMCRAITSADGFEDQCWPSQLAYDENPDLEILRVPPESILPDSSGAFTLADFRYPVLNAESLSDIRRCWRSFRTLFANADDSDMHRLRNSLNYFFYAWRSYYMDHMCLNLAIVLESLFAPPSQGELAHQIAFNASRFLATDPLEREAVYSLIKSFYGVRSHIVHGAEPRVERLYRCTPSVYWLCADILKRLLDNPDMARRFCLAEERQQLLREWTFDSPA
jgi:hypothetical protein